MLNIDPLAVQNAATEVDMCLFTATGAVDGWNGDHFLLAPPYIVAKKYVDEIVNRLVKIIDSVFADIYARKP